MQRMRMWPWLLAAVSACYRPASETACLVTCGDDMACPGELVCDGSNTGCHAMGAICAANLGDATDAGSGSGFCFGRPQNGGLLRLCFASQPTGDLPLTGMIDTDTDPRCDAISRSECVLVATTIEVTGPLITTGSQPLVLVAATTIDVSSAGVIDAASYSGRKNGPAGRDPATCTPGNGSSATSVGQGTSSGGGAGGSFATAGGAGGETATAAGGVASPGQAPTTVRGGCSGGNGGAANPNADGCAGGAGGGAGGAVYLISGGAIIIDGAIAAYGAGGTQGADIEQPQEQFADFCGGGGGGAGGLIGLDARALSGSGSVIANGGGGGGGGVALAAKGSHATDGSDGSLLGGSRGGSGSGEVKAPGGNGATTVAAGAAGFGNGSNIAGGGGGGGGAGFVLVVVDAGSDHFTGVLQPH